MNININPQDNPFLVKNNNKYKSTLQSGAILTGVITSKDDNNAIVKFSNKSKLNIDSSQVEGNNGDKVSFQVLDNANNKLVLKQIKTVNFSDTLTAQETMKNANVQELYEKAGFAQDLDKSNDEENNLEDNQEHKKIDLAIMMLKRKLKYGNASNSKSAISALISSGIDISKVNLSTMSKVVTGANNNNSVPDKNQEQLQQLQKQLESKGFSKEEVSTKIQIARQLNDSGLAVNDANIEQISKVLDDVKQLQTSTIDTTNILKNEKDLNIKNLLASKHSHTQAPSQLPTGLDNEIKSLLKSINIDSNAKNMDIAKNFIANEVPITSENFAKLDFLQNGIQNINQEHLINTAVEQIRANNQLVNIDLTKLLKQTAPIDYNQTISKLDNVGYNTINHLQKNDIPVTLDNLVNNIQPENTDTVDNYTTPAFVTKKQIIEIQLRMTSTVMFTLNKNNINLNTQPLLDALNSIKQAEDEVYSNTLTQMNAIANSVNKTLLTNTVDAINNVKSTIQALPQTASIQGLFNKISSVTNIFPQLYNSGEKISLEKVSNQMTKMAEAYDEGVANPNAKFDDNFAKVANQVAPLLESLGIQPTDSKVKAGQVLVRNNIDVTEENIKNVETINLKIERLLEKLTPHIASKMLAEGINPLTEDLDTMLNYIDTFNDVYGTNSDDNLAKALIKMDKDKDIDDNTLNGIKAIYRALNTINKNGLASVGSYLDTKRELTLNSLLDSAKTYSQNRGKHNVLNKAIDDNTPISQKFTMGQSIKELISNNVAPERTYEYEQISRFMDNANYEGLKQLIQENPNMYDEVLQSVTDRLVEINKTQNTESLEFLQQVVDDVLNANPETVAQLAKSNIPVNKKNLDTLTKIKEDKNYSSKTLQKLIKDEDIDTSNIETEFNNKLLQTANSNLSTLLNNSNVDIKSLQLYGEAMNVLNIQNSLNQSSELAYKAYPIKLPVSSEITNLQMYVLNDNAFDKEETNIAFALNLSNGGEVNATAKYNNKTNCLDVNIVCENDEFSTVLENNKQELVNIFNEIADNNVSITIS